MTKGNSGHCFRLAAMTRAGAIVGFFLWGLLLCCSGSLRAAQPTPRTYGYALTYLFWANYQTSDGRKECPQGFNRGAREEFSARYPASRQKLAESALEYEVQTWFPTLSPDRASFRQATGGIAYGLNLDGKAGPNDFSGPDAERGIDNQLYRAMGCVVGYRGPDGLLAIFDPMAIVDNTFNRLLIELTGVEDLNSDSDVEVHVYRGLDRLLRDATGKNVMAGGSQRIDERFGKPFIRQLKGRIDNGVLTTEPVDRFVIPWTVLDDPTMQVIRGMRLQLKLRPAGAEGLLAGYTDIDNWYRTLIRTYSTHHLSAGQISAPALYSAVHRLADGYPDPKSGANTAISSALHAKFVQVYIQRPSK